MRRKIYSLVLVVLCAVNSQSLTFASSKTFPSGIQFEGLQTCTHHNVIRHCYLRNLFPESGTNACFEGSPTNDNTKSTMIKCTSTSTLPKQTIKKCKKIHRKFVNADEVCNISKAMWDYYQECYGEDIQTQRRTQCPKGCEDVPAYHVCDWTEKQYQYYKHCSSIKFLAQQTRENICPQGMSDVGETGPPIRINIIGSRKPHQRNYLTFDKNFKLEFSSITGKKTPRYCLLKDNDKKCIFKPFSKTAKIEKSKYIIPSAGMKPGTYRLIAKNGNNKESAINFVILAAHLESSEQKISKGTWIELIGPDLSPVIPPNNNPSSYYLSNKCDVLYKEVKDISGKRWKCMESNYVGNNYDYAGYGNTDVKNSCQIYERCNSYGVRFNIQICSQGAVPAQSADMKWEPFVFPGQFINYPQKNNQCDPTDPKYQAVDPQQGKSV